MEKLKKAVFLFWNHLRRAHRWNADHQDSALGRRIYVGHFHQCQWQEGPGDPAQGSSGATTGCYRSVQLRQAAARPHSLGIRIMSLDRDLSTLQPDHLRDRDDSAGFSFPSHWTLERAGITSESHRKGSMRRARSLSSGSHHNRRHRKHSDEHRRRHHHHHKHERSHRHEKAGSRGRISIQYVSSDELPPHRVQLAPSLTSSEEAQIMSRKWRHWTRGRQPVIPDDASTSNSH